MTTPELLSTRPTTASPHVSTLRLNLMRAMYLLMVVGLGLTIWPGIIWPGSPVADPGSVVFALLGALGLLSILGLRYPLQMLPLLMFELVWKVIWVAAFAAPMWLGPGLDAYAVETLFACALGLVLTPIVLPWRYITREYFTKPGARWWNRTAPSGTTAP